MISGTDIPRPVTIKKKILEKHVEQYLYKRMKKLGGECFKWSSINMTGVTDRICIFPPNKMLFMPEGLITFVELKKDNKAKLSPRQNKFHNRMGELHVQHVYVLYGKDDVDRWLKSMGY